MTPQELNEKRYKKRKHREAILEARRANLPRRLEYFRNLIMQNMMVKPMLGVLKKNRNGKVVRPTFLQAVWYWIKYPFRDRSNPPVARAMRQMVGV